MTNSSIQIRQTDCPAPESDELFDDLDDVGLRIRRLSGGLMQGLPINASIIRAAVLALVDLHTASSAIGVRFSDWNTDDSSPTAAADAIAAAGQEALAVNAAAEDALSAATAAAGIAPQAREWAFHSAFYADTACDTTVDGLVDAAIAAAAGDAFPAAVAIYAATSAIARRIVAIGQDAQELVREARDARTAALLGAA